ncbi:hypothetical protein WMY93_007753 [Mugilogobius chulae]|uniref:Uncharacterized protein n=1 Tax=Mugilogobius chulae TaxID=88201 RepID=A0AAW0PDZ0_9GOBI
MTLMGTVEPPMEDAAGQRRGSRAYQVCCQLYHRDDDRKSQDLKFVSQIFPETNDDDSDSERLPSIWWSPQSRPKQRAESCAGPREQQHREDEDESQGSESTLEGTRDMTRVRTQRTESQGLTREDMDQHSGGHRRREEREREREYMRERIGREQWEKISRKE